MRISLGERSPQSELGTLKSTSTTQVGQPSRELVPLAPKIRRRFYEPVVLFKALIQTVQSQASSRVSEPTERLSTTRERVEKFVYRLATVCDKEKGGNFVTSFALLQRLESSEAVYVFGCNGVDSPQLQQVTDFVVTLLQKLRAADSITGRSSRNSLKRDILRHVLIFNRLRVEQYVKWLHGHIQDCIHACSLNERQEDTILKEELVTLSYGIPKTSFEGFDLDEYIDGALGCIRVIKAFISSANGVYPMINERSREGGLPGMKSVECWSEVRHYISRLYVYEEAAREFVEIQDELPEIFEDYNVIPILSSKVESNPLGRKSEVASNIIGRMTSKVEEITAFREMVEELQIFSLNERVAGQCKSGNFKPRVHSEVLVLDWILNDGLSSQYQFFNGWKYIGSSKPTCRLCQYYFRSHPQGVKVRPSHGNLYTNWKFPDVYRDQGPGATQARLEILHKMLNSIRDDAFDMVNKKQRVGKRHDSNTYSMPSVRQTETEASVSRYGDASVDELGEMLRDGLTLRPSATPDDLVRFVSDDEGDFRAS